MGADGSEDAVEHEKVSKTTKNIDKNSRNLYSNVNYDLITRGQVQKIKEWAESDSRMDKIIKEQEYEDERARQEWIRQNADILHDQE